jgi:acyl-CoA thioester hydrolase
MMSLAMTSPSGIIADGVHRYGLRVYYEDTDALGMVYYANYLKYAERARTEMIRLLGFATINRDNDTAFAVRRCEVDYLSPARLDDELEVVSGLIAIGGASFDLEQTVLRDGERLVRLEVRLAVLSSSGRPTRLADDFRSALQPFLRSS